MPTCSVSGCTQRNRQNGITFHRFPSDPVLRQRWITAIQRECFVPSKFAVLCSKHFREEDVDRTSLSVVRLREGAVPSIFDAFSPHLCPVQNTQNPPDESVIPDHDYTYTPLIPNSDNEIHLPLPEPATTETGVLNNPGTPEKQALKRKLEDAQSQLAFPSHHCPVKNTPKPPDESVIPDHDYTNTPPIPNSDKEIHLLLPEPVTTEKGLLNNPDTLEKEALKRKLEHTQSQLLSSRKKVKLLLQDKRRLQKKAAHLSAVISDLKKQDMPSSDTLQILENCGGGIGYFLKRQIVKKSGQALPVSYSPDLQRFASTLHFYSPHAYRYVRKMFGTCLPHCLPHPRTIEKWRQSIDKKSGFTEQAFSALTEGES
ncbi:THAP domain-containing protein 1-like [Microcaecilia unicolor]|uniref:THAP domain-containing protein 1-like n=1 Tax=Microcaecilia unicolor TaxID=1415580 RepID=A0A6P7XGM8_9AMPH|nr:THAP domain-containing protein 1-like [Microcaecilia unicolor]